MPRAFWGLRPWMSGFTATAPFLSPPKHKGGPIRMYLAAWGNPMTTIKRAHLFGGPKRMRRAKERIERVQLLTASARERAMDLAQKYKDHIYGRPLQPAASRKRCDRRVAPRGKPRGLRPRQPKRGKPLALRCRLNIMYLACLPRQDSLLLGLKKPPPKLQLGCRLPGKRRQPKPK